MSQELPQEDIKQKDIMEEVGLTMPEMKEWREANLEFGKDFFKRGVAYYWTQEAYLLYMEEVHPQLLAGARYAPPKDVDEENDCPVIEGIEDPRKEEPAPEPVQEPEPEPKSEVIEVKVIQAARNGKFVIAGLNGKKIAVRCKPSQQKKLVGKPLKVIPTEHDYYTIAP